MTSETKSRFALLKIPVVIFVVGLIIFGTIAGERLKSPSRDNHYVYLADAMLHSRLHLEGKPPHLNDWAKYDGKWFVSFPPAPALFMIPGVAIWGLEFNDRVFTLFFAAAGPALLYLLLALLVAKGRFKRTPFELVLLSTAYGLGSVYFFSAVQGSVWFTAHMVGGVMLLLYLIAAIDARHPLLAGLFIGLAFACRPTMLLGSFFFLYEVLDKYAPDEPCTFFQWIKKAILSSRRGELVQNLFLFAVPVAAVLAAIMFMNWVRFDDAFVFGHKYLRVRWSGRIERWGLFHYHYLSRNLAVILTLLPWLSLEEPYIQVSNHGLAIWFTSPFLLWILWPVEQKQYYKFLALSALVVAIPSILYQNSGWVQFGYRFSLDFMVFLILMLAAGRRKLGGLFIASVVFALMVNSFGAWTFDREREFYPRRNPTAYFQPD